MGHIQSAWCAGQAEVVTAAHNRCARLILRQITQETKDRDGLRLLTAEGKRTMDNYWLRGKLEAEAQYRDLRQGIQWSLPVG